MKSYILFLSILFTICTVDVAKSQQSIYVGIPSNKINYYASSQRNSNWCWAASIQMIMNYYGIDITQEQIVSRSYGRDPYGNLPNWTGNLKVISANLNNWSVDNSGRKYSVQSSLYSGAPTPSYLIQELSEQHPVLIGYRSGTGGHAVIITAVSYISTASGPRILSIVVRDPWPSQTNINNRGRVEYSGRSLASLMMAHWYVRVH